MEVSLLFYTHAVAFYIPFTTSAPLRISRNSICLCGGLRSGVLWWGGGSVLGED